jgi:hypothetical protein
MNLTTTNQVTLGKTNNCKSTHLEKHYLAETHTCKGSNKNNQQMVKA